MTALQTDRLITAFIKGIVDRSIAVNELDRWFERLCVSPEYLPTLLYTAIRCEDLEERLIACWLMMAVVERGVPIQPDVVNLAKITINGALRGDPFWQRFTCSLFIRGGITKDVVDVFRPLLFSSDSIVAVHAAAMLRPFLQDEALAVLRRLVAGHEAFVVCLAAVHLLRAKDSQQQASAALCSRLASLESEDATSILVDLKLVDAPPPSLTGTLAHMLCAAHLPTTLRRAAVAVLVKAPDNDTSADRALIGALESEDWQLLECVIIALRQRGELTSRLAERFVRMLDHADVNVRGTGILGLEKLTGDAKHVIPAMLAHFRRETKMGLSFSLARAIAKASHAACSELIAIIRELDIRTAQPAMAALAEQGALVVGRVSQALLDETDHDCKVAFSTILLKMSDTAATMLPLVGDVIDEIAASDEQSFLSIMMHVEAAGRGALPLLPALVRTVVLGARSVRCIERAENMLVLLGPDALTGLTRAAELSGQVDSPRLRRVLQRLRMHNEAFHELMAFNDDKALEQVLHAARLIRERGRMTLPDLSDELDRRRERGEIGADVPISARSLQTTLERLRTDLGIEVTEGKQGVRGITIRQEAWPFIALLDTYLRPQRPYQRKNT